MTILYANSPKTPAEQMAVIAHAARLKPSAITGVYHATKIGLDRLNPSRMNKVIARYTEYMDGPPEYEEYCGRSVEMPSAQIPVCTHRITRSDILARVKSLDEYKAKWWELRDASDEELWSFIHSPADEVLVFPAPIPVNPVVCPFSDEVVV